jgi:hypothetical protein
MAVPILPQKTMMQKLMQMMVHVPMIVHIMANGIVAMANVFQQVMFVMAQVNSVMLDGVLTVPMAQMKA